MPVFFIRKSLFNGICQHNLTKVRKGVHFRSDCGGYGGFAGVSSFFQVSFLRLCGGSIILNCSLDKFGNAVFFQLSDSHKAVNRVSCKSADRLCNNKVEFMREYGCSKVILIRYRIRELRDILPKRHCNKPRTVIY